jgi:hypothetical protein
MTAIKPGVAPPPAGPAPYPPTGNAMLELKFMEPQSRWVIRVLFRRNFDAFTDSAKVRVNWAMLLWDVIIVWLLIQYL